MALNRQQHNPEPTAAPKPVASDWSWYQHQFWAMNTTVTVKLMSNLAVQPILAEVEMGFHSFERRLSRFKLDSELSKLNQSLAPVFTASDTLFAAIEFSLLAAEWTGGIYDPTILPYLEQSGYQQSFDTLPQACPLWTADQQHLSPNSNPGQRQGNFRDVSLYRPRRQISRPVGVTFDLGGMGKGWTVDRVADRLQSLGPFLINAGGDIFAYHTPPGQKGWQVELIHPCQPEETMAAVWLNHQALATSTIAKRRWIHEGRLNHHLIDPRTGAPAQTDALSVTVISHRTVLAEVLAKTALVMGAEPGLRYLENLEGVEGLIYTADGVIIATSGMPLV